MRRAIVIPLLSLAFTSAVGQLRPKARFVITSEQVTVTLNAVFAKKGGSLLANQVSLPAAITATQKSPALEVKSVQALGRLQTSEGVRSGSAIKLSCTNPGTCLPFYALVTWPDSDDILAVTAQASFPSAKPLPSDPAIVKPGARLTLLLDSGAAHIQMSVISMDRGSVGSHIKVRSSDHKQMYSAEVVSAGIAKGTY